MEGKGKDHGEREKPVGGRIKDHIEEKTNDKEEKRKRRTA